MKVVSATALAALLWSVGAEDARNKNYDYACDSSSVSYDLAVSKLTPNQFHKICSKQLSSGKAFGQPQCGDGSSFGFFFSRPLQKKENSERILIEFLGGGACFDATSCGEMADYLSFPGQFNDFVGLSCSEIAQGVENGDEQNNFPISMLCAKQIGDVDFTTYNTIVIPYCTQDVNVGDNEIYYSNGDNNEAIKVYHKGAHNMMSVLRWIFKNFKKPTHIALTGCSAGGTVLPVAYDLVNSHYNTFGVRAVQINTISDSPVYLTPQWFLDKAINNWNPWPIMKRVGFNHNKWKSSTDYPTKVWDHVLRRGSNRDRWGIVTHTQDEISQAYYEWMSGAYADDDDAGGGRNLEGDDGGQSQWWYELSTSIATIEKKHHNVKNWYIEEDGHCSFGLYYPLQENGFESWASNIFVENKILGHTAPSVPLFLSAMIAGTLLCLGIFFSASKKREIELDGGDLLTNKDQSPKRSIGSLSMFWLAGLGDIPYTAGYAIALTFYFWTMILKEGFAHPVNNPSLGPSAIALSSFGINNPSLLVYKSQLFRLITSNFLCSGILTYIMTMICLWFYTRKIEKMIGKHFLTVCALIMLGPNLIYALICSGASCSTMSFVLGLLAFKIMALRATKEASCSMYTVLILFFALTASVFSFNNWFMLGSAVLIGGAIRFLFEISEGGHSENDSADGFTEFYKAPTEFSLRKKRMFPLLFAYGLIFVVLLLRLRRPNELYLQPFYTGCELKYTNDFDDLAGELYDNGEGGDSNDEGDKRRLGGSGDEQQYDSSLCAEFCVPHLACKFAGMGARQLGVPIYEGSCTEQGYNEHVADKTFLQMSYSLDVEVYSKYSYNNNDDREDNKDR